MTEKESIQVLVNAQPDDTYFEELLRELPFERTADRGLTDVLKSGSVLN